MRLYWELFILNTITTLFKKVKLKFTAWIHTLEKLIRNI